MTDVSLRPEIGRFIDRSARLGVSMTRTTPAGVAEAVVRISGGAGARRSVVADDLGPLKPQVIAALEAAGITILSGRTAIEVESMDIGVTGCAFAVAESGSIAIVGRDRLARFATMLPPVHIAVVFESDIVPTLDEAGERLEEALREGAAIASLVTGPSRTADVEKTLAVGVHGPREVHIILIADERLDETTGSEPNPRRSKRGSVVAPAAAANSEAVT